MDLNFKWTKKKKNRGAVANKNAYARVGIIKNGTNKKGQVRKSFLLTLYPDIVKEMRLMRGDRVYVGFDKTTKLVAIRRTTSDDGLKLTEEGRASLKVQFSYESYPFKEHESLYLEKNHFFKKDDMVVFNLVSFGVETK